MAIQSSSAVLKAYFDTGDVPTAAQFGDLIDSTAYYDSSLEKLFLSGSGTGSFGQIQTKELHPYNTSSVAGNSISVSASLLPPFVGDEGVGVNLGAILTPWKHLFAASASVDFLNARTGSVVTVSGGLSPLINSSYDLGTTDLKWNMLHISGINVDYISSSLIPDQDNIRDLGSSGREWRNLYIDGTAYIDTIDAGTTFASLIIGTGSITVVSSSRIDGNAYGDITISGSLIPGTTNVFNIGNVEKKYKELYVSGAAIDFISSSLIPDQDNLRDLGSSTREWKDLYIDGTAYIDTLSIDTIPTVTIATASITVISSSRIDGVGGYGNVIVSGGLVPGTTNVFDLGTTTAKWGELFLGTGSIDVVSSSRIDGVGGYGNVIVSGGLVPGTTSVFDLGTTSKKWGTAFIITASVDFVSSSLIPATDNTYDLGSSSREWKDLYIDGTANIDTLSTDTASIGRIGSSLIPSNRHQYSFGNSTFTWKDIYQTSASFTVSASLAAVKLENLPTSSGQARLIGSGALWLSGSHRDSSKTLCVFTGGS